MDNEISSTRSSTKDKDEVNTYINFKVDKEKDYSNPLLFWQEYQQLFPKLTKLARRTFSMPCSSAAVEREFSPAGQIVHQRRSNLDPSAVNNILFLRSIENNKTKN